MGCLNTISNKAAEKRSEKGVLARTSVQQSRRRRWGHGRVYQLRSGYQDKERGGARARAVDSMRQPSVSNSARGRQCGTHKPTLISTERKRTSCCCLRFPARWATCRALLHRLTAREPHLLAPQDVGVAEVVLETPIYICAVGRTVAPAREGGAEDGKGAGVLHKLQRVEATPAQ